MPALERMTLHPEGLVVVFDLWMPGMDGYAVMQALAADSPLATRHGYLLMTAVGRTLPDKVRLLLKQLDIKLIHKPFDLDELVKAVEEVAKRRS